MTVPREEPPRPEQAPIWVWVLVCLAVFAAGFLVEWFVG